MMGDDMGKFIGKLLYFFVVLFFLTFSTDSRALGDCVLRADWNFTKNRCDYKYKSGDKGSCDAWNLACKYRTPDSCQNLYESRSCNAIIQNEIASADKKLKK